MNLELRLLAMLFAEKESELIAQCASAYFAIKLREATDGSSMREAANKVRESFNNSISINDLRHWENGYSIPNHYCSTIVNNIITNRAAFHSAGGEAETFSVVWSTATHSVAEFDDKQLARRLAAAGAHSMDLRQICSSVLFDQRWSRLHIQSAG